MRRITNASPTDRVPNASSARSPKPLPRFIELFVLGLTALSARAEHCPAPAALSALRQQIASAEIVQLDNGATLTLLPDAQAQSAALAVGLSVGSRNERDGQHGFAHLLEHVLFTGSQHLPPGAYEHVLRVRGGIANASTSFDVTEYHAAAAPGALSSLLWAQADALLRPLFPEASVRAQQQAVREEMRLRIEQPPYVGPAMQAALGQFAGSGWGHGVIGSEASVYAASPASLEHFWRQHYGGQRQHWVLGGQFDPAQMTAEWRALLAHHPQGEADPAAEALPIRHFRLTVTDARAPWPVLVLGWYLPAADRAEGRAALLAFRQQFDEHHGPLMQRLREDRQVFFRRSALLDLPGAQVAILVLAPRGAVSLDQLAGQVRASLADADANADPATVPDRRCALMQQHWADTLQELSTPLGQTRWLAVQRANGRDAVALLDEALPGAEAVRRAHAQLRQAPETGLELQPAWYWRWTKALLEILPRGWVESLEEAAL